MTQSRVHALAPKHVPGLVELHQQLQGAWAADTSSYDNWTSDRPSTGQCAVTALIVQEQYGGDLMRTVVAGDSHYFNRLPDGTAVDLTRDQFDHWDPTPLETRSREYVLSHPATAARYELLRSRLRGH